MTQVAETAYPLSRPARAELAGANGLELVLAASVGAASLSLRVLLETLARATRRQPPSTDSVTALAFAGLAIGLATSRTVARTLGAGLDSVTRVAGGAMESMPTVLRNPIDDRLAWWHEREGARNKALGDAEMLAEDLVAALVPRIVTATLDQLNLTSLVSERVDVDAIVRGVDLDAVASKIDVDAVAARLDVEALVERIDLDGIARTVIDRIDLPEIIRRSTGSVASETVRGVRMQGIGADRSLEGLVDRLLRRRHERRLDAPGVTDAEEALSQDGGDG